MCTVLLPPGDYPIAVKYIISYINTYTKPVPLYARQAQTVTNGIAVPIFDPEGLVRATPRPLYFRDKGTVTDVREAEWASGTAWTGLENFAHTGFRNSNSPELSQTPYLLRCPGRCYVNIRALIHEGKYNMT
jgi:hypothetical protein